jgi:hypothetical protein
MRFSRRRVSAALLLAATLVGGTVLVQRVAGAADGPARTLRLELSGSAQLKLPNGRTCSATFRASEDTADNTEDDWPLGGSVQATATCAGRPDRELWLAVSGQVDDNGNLTQVSVQTHVHGAACEWRDFDGNCTEYDNIYHAITGKRGLPKQPAAGYRTTLTHDQWTRFSLTFDNTADAATFAVRASVGTG